VVVTVRARAPFDGPLSVEVGDAVHPLDNRLARTIFVEAADTKEDEQETV
jgi:Fe2+ transport system protein FeoA